MDFCVLKKNSKPINIKNIKLDDIVSLIIGQRTQNIDSREVYCRVDKLRIKNGETYGIEVTHLLKYEIPQGNVFVVNPSQPSKTNNPQKTKDPRKYGYNRVNFKLHF